MVFTFDIRRGLPCRLLVGGRLIPRFLDAPLQVDPLESGLHGHHPGMDNFILTLGFLRGSFFIPNKPPSLQPFTSLAYLTVRSHTYKKSFTLTIGDRKLWINFVLINWLWSTNIQKQITEPIIIKLGIFKYLSDCGRYSFLKAR